MFESCWGDGYLFQDGEADEMIYDGVSVDDDGLMHLRCEVLGQ